MNENPPQMNAESLLRQRFYDFLNVHAGNHEGCTERGEEIIQLACSENSDFLAEKLVAARVEGVADEKERIIACGHAHEQVVGFQPYGFMDEEKENAIFLDGFRDGRAMLMIDVLSKRDPRTLSNPST